IHTSADCGETWEAAIFTTAFQVEDAAWLSRDGAPALLLATSAGLYELTPRPGGSPVQALVDRADANRAFYAVVAATDARGTVNVAVAAQGMGGVFLSSEGGQPGTFRRAGLQGEDIRELAVQVDGPRRFLWAGAAAQGGADAGKGC